eukprot:TRINITY_DN20571_c0_g1_i1.p1 TRINITY_DN20571_c0_g1~~TRINITY_DN20571_c0_g1_i1.p1  ORF type:complete len:329 (+),score=56.31 TRINITY_DN20571_c0_g1_i1:63-1049(+)
MPLRCLWLAAVAVAVGEPWVQPKTAEEVSLPEVWNGYLWPKAQELLKRIENTTLHPPAHKTDKACRATHAEWRRKLVRAVRGGLVKAKFRSVSGSGFVALPIEPLQPFHPLMPLPRAYVDEGCWNASRWFFIDLGARYFVRLKTKRGGKRQLQFGSFFEGLCGIPGGERFIFHSFDLNDYGRGNVPSFVHWHHAAVGIADGWVRVAGQQAGAHAVPLPEEAAGAVRSIDFSSWLLQHVKEADFVVVKMDIEGMEFAVLRSLLVTGAHRLVDELYFECHGIVDADVRKAWRLHLLPKGGEVPERNVRPLDCAFVADDLRAAGVYVHDWD